MSPTSPPKGSKRTPPFVGAGLVTRHLRVASSDVLLVKGLIEAHEGVANVFGDETGGLVLAAPLDREAELDALVAIVLEVLSGSSRSSRSSRPSRAASP